MPERKNPLAEAFSVDNDALGERVSADVQPAAEMSDKQDVVAEDPQTEEVEVSEVEPGLVKMGTMTFVRKGSELVRAEETIAFTMKMTALEKHRLQRYADEHRLSMADVIRDALGDIIR